MESKDTVIPLYSIQEETQPELDDIEWDHATNLPTSATQSNKQTTCCLCLFRILLKIITYILGFLTFTFALLVTPLAMYIGRATSNTELRHAIRNVGGKFIQWGDKNQFVLEYFVLGSQDPNADVMLLYSGAFSPGDFWKHMNGDQSADIWGRQLGLRLICPTNPGLACSSLPKSRLMTREQLVEVAIKLLSKEKVKGKIFVGGMSQGSHAAGIIADRMSERIKGVLLMCPYMPITKLHELICNGKKCIGDDYLNGRPSIKMYFDLFPDNFILQNIVCQMLPVLKHSFCLFRAWSGFTRRNFGVAPDMYAATQRLDAEGNSEWIDAFIRGQRRAMQYNIYGEAQFKGFGTYSNMAGKDGKTPVLVATDINQNQIPDMLCSSRQSWWMVNEIPNARLLTCDQGYGHLTPLLYCHELMHAAMPILRKEDQMKETEEVTTKSALSELGNGNQHNVTKDRANSVTSFRSQRSGTSARTRFRKRREDIWQWTDHKKTDAPNITKHSPIPWSIRRETSVYQKEMREWVTKSYVLRLHFGFVFIALISGLSYSYTSYIVWKSVGIPEIICITGAVLLGPMLLINTIVAARYQDPSSALHIVTNSANVIQQGGMVDDNTTNMQVSSSIGCCNWSFQGYIIFIVWVVSNSICVYYLNDGNVNVFSNVNNVNNATTTTAFTTTALIPIWLQVWHVAISISFAFILVRLIALMSTGIDAIKTASSEIVSRIKTWSPPIRGESRTSTMTNSLTMIAADINLFDESIVSGYSSFFAATIHSILLGTFAFIAAVCVAILENKTWLDPSNEAGVAVFGLLIGFGALAMKVLSTMATTTSICSQIPYSTSRLRLRVVELMDDEADERDADATRWLQSVSESVRALCDSVLAHPIGFRLSGFVVSPKMVMQVLYAFASILFLVLAGGRRVY